MPGRKRPQAHERGSERYVSQFGQLGEQVPGFGVNDAAAAIKHRPAAFQDHLRHPLEILMPPFAKALGTPGTGAGGVACLCLFHQHAFGEIDQHRPRPSRDGRLESLIHDARNLRRRLHQITSLGTRQADAHRVRLLECVLADQRRRHLPGQRHHRNGIHQRRCKTGHHVGGSGPGCYQAHPWFPGSSRVSIGGKSRSLLVPNQKVMDACAIQGVVQRKHRPARKTEDHFYLLAVKALQQDFRTCELLSHVL